MERLSRQPSLLVLDNFEHLVEEGAAVVRTLLERVPRSVPGDLPAAAGSGGGAEFVSSRPLPTPDGAGPPERLCTY